MPTTVVGTTRFVREHVAPLDAVARAQEEVSRLLAAAGLPPLSGAPPLVLRTKVTAAPDAEEKHTSRVRASRSYLFVFNAASLAAAAATVMYAVQSVQAGWAVRRLPAMRFHFLGTQVLWNTQPYDATYTLPLTKPLSALYVLTAAFTAGACAWKWWVWVSRNRDVGFGKCTRRTRVSVGLQLTRLVLLAACSACAALYGSWAVPVVVDRTYTGAACALGPVFGQGASHATTTLQGDTSGACAAVLADPVLLSSERSYHGVVPAVDTGAAAVDGNVTVYMTPYGPELGCAPGADLFPVPPAQVPTLGSLTSSWVPFQARPSRRCLSQLGYVFSNWFTFSTDGSSSGSDSTTSGLGTNASAGASDSVPSSAAGAGGACSALAYALWLNATRVSAFGHAEQWFCAEAALATNETHVVVTYNTSGWLATTTGDSCLTPNDTAAVAAEAEAAFAVAPAWPAAAVRALASVSGLLGPIPTPTTTPSTSRSATAAPASGSSASLTPAPVSASASASGSASVSGSTTLSASGSATGTASISTTGTALQRAATPANSSGATATPAASSAPAPSSSFPASQPTSLPQRVLAVEVAALRPAWDLPAAVFPRTGLPALPLQPPGNGSSGGGTAATQSPEDAAAAATTAAAWAAWAAWSPAAPDTCAEARYACVVRQLAPASQPASVQYLRTASLHGCQRVAARPASTAAYSAELVAGQARWGAAVTAVTFAMAAEVAVEWLETAVSCCFF